MTNERNNHQLHRRCRKPPFPASVPVPRRAPPPPRSRLRRTPFPARTGRIPAWRPWRGTIPSGWTTRTTTTRRRSIAAVMVIFPGADAAAAATSAATTTTTTKRKKKLSLNPSRSFAMSEIYSIPFRVRAMAKPRKGQLMFLLLVNCSCPILKKMGTSLLLSMRPIFAKPPMPMFHCTMRLWAASLLALMSIMKMNSSSAAPAPQGPNWINSLCYASALPTRSTRSTAMSNGGKIPSRTNTSKSLRWSISSRLSKSCWTSKSGASFRPTGLDSFSRNSMSKMISSASAKN
mmetsp:Transcript_2970/g.6224  ORF Transcript_2970/g.6224 Transcript_2970/m.6224 type:complete len:290 (-) Transcript_2970:369-1238(-)